MATEWDTHTFVNASGDHRFDAELDPGWVVGGGVNGGILLGIIGRAVAETLPAEPHPLAVSAHYLSASTPGPRRSPRARRTATCGRCPTTTPRPPSSPCVGWLR